MFRLKAGDQAPDFTTETLDQREFTLTELRGRKVLLSFFRDIDCPFCNHRVHTLQAHSATFEAHNLVNVGVFNSTAAQMFKPVTKRGFQFTILPDPSQRLYQLYQTERSVGRFFRGFFQFNILATAMRGGYMHMSSLFRDKLLPAEFLLDEKGMLLDVHYNRILGDHMPISHIVSLLEAKAA